MQHDYLNIWKVYYKKIAALKTALKSKQDRKTKKIITIITNQYTNFFLGQMELSGILYRKPAAVMENTPLRPAERGTEGVTVRGHMGGVTVRGHMGAWGSELSGLECKIHQLKLWPADAIMFFLISGRNSDICGRYDLILLITRC